MRTAPLLLAAGLAPAVSPALAGTFVFGDSSVEQGNLYALPGFDRTGSPYYAPDGFSRESNGPVWVEHLAPGIAPAAGAAPGARDVNFAFSGATSGEDNIAGPVADTGFDAQIDAFGERGLRGAAGDLFVVAIGTNDFIRDLGVRDLRETSAEAIANIGAGLERLSGYGAERILVEDAPNFHLAPAFAGLVPPEDKDRFDAVMRGVLDRHRAEQIAALRDQAARTGTDLVTVKVSKLFDHVLAHAAELGFTNVTDACYDEATGTLCSTDKAVQNGYLFFDGLHLTETGQRLQADYYRALLGQLAGSAHALPESLARHGQGRSDALAARARAARAAAWAGPTPGRGLSVSAEAGGETDEAGVAGLGLGWSDGQSWTVRLDAAFKRGGLGGFAGASDVEGFSATLSGERRWGGFRLGASAGLMSAAAEGRRDMPVAKMRATHDADLDARFAEVAFGYVWGEGALSALPAVWGRWSEVEVGGFAERGDTGLEMEFDGVEASGVTAGAGVTVRYAATARLTPWLGLSWETPVAGFETTARGRLADNSAAPVARRLDLGQDRGEARLGLDVELGAGASLTLSGWATTEEERGASARLSWRF